jgi:GAF domain-containing protein
MTATTAHEQTGAERAAARAEAIRRWEVLEVPPDCYHEVAALASRLFSVPYAVVTVIDEDDIWFHGRHGVDLKGIPIAPGLCHAVVETGEPILFEDARIDPAACANSLVSGEFGLRFYAGAPLRTADGHNVGTIAVFDTAPRPTPEDEADILGDLASLVVREFELRLAARASVAAEQEEKLAAEMAAQQAHGKIVDLEGALGTHGTIGTAMGILMAQRKISSQQAFAELRKVSQNKNIKLASVARTLVTNVERNLKP